MCGIVGFCDFNQNIEQSALKRMSNTLKHRGPDDNGTFFQSSYGKNIGLGHQRLSILDTSTSGHQPMFFEELVIVYNGEVYNFKEIRQELEVLGYAFQTSTDTEVILKAWHCWKEKAIDYFIGMFAFVIYDESEQKIFMVRDRVGVKPLYWFYDKYCFLFSSELKSFHEIDVFRKTKMIDTDSLSMYFQYGYIPEPKSIFKNTYKLKAAHILTLDLITQKISETKYWGNFSNNIKNAFDFDEKTALEESESILTKAFRYRMVSDVPVGLFLSGGYDSSLVAALLQKDSIKKINTYTIGFEEDRYNEAPFAKKVAEHLGTNHTEYYCTTQDAANIIPTLVETYDEPFGDSSAIPTILVSNLAAQNVKVSLSADGGDELFAGYDSYPNLYNQFNKYKQIPKVSRKLIANMSNLLSDNIDFLPLRIYNFQHKLYKYSNLLKSNHIIQHHLTEAKYFQEQEIDLLFSNELNQDIFLDNIRNENGVYERLNEILAFDIQHYLKDNILIKVDRATMSASLEGREPFLDHNVIEFAMRLPEKYKIKDGKGKYIIKKLTHKYIPESLMDRKKMGFSIPLFQWFQNDLKVYFDMYLNKNMIKKTGLFNYLYIESLLKRYKRGDGNPHQLWLILIFQMWWERWMD